MQVLPMKIIYLFHKSLIVSVQELLVLTYFISIYLHLSILGSKQQRHEV